jgi:hypothetical protein
MVLQARLDGTSNEYRQHTLNMLDAAGLAWVDGWIDTDR